MQKLILTKATLGKDPEIRHTDNNTVANFSVAVNETYKDKNGEKKTITDWFNCVAWGGLATLAEKYLSKGSVINIVGKVKTRSYDDKDGNKKYVTEVRIDEMEFVSGGKKPQEDQKPNSNDDQYEELGF